METATVAKKRPVNLNLFTIKFPIPAVVSILHRTSGVLLFLLIPLVLWMLQRSLASATDWHALQHTLSQPLLQIIIWIFLLSLLFHLLAGVRHLLMDLGIGESLKAGRFSSWLVIGLAVILTVWIGFLV